MIYCAIFLLSLGEIIAIMDRYMNIQKTNLDKSKVQNFQQCIVYFAMPNGLIPNGHNGNH